MKYEIKKELERVLVLEREQKESELRQKFEDFG